MTKNQTFNSEAGGLKTLGSPTSFVFENPTASILEAFENRYPGRDYLIEFLHPEFTSLCPKTGQPDFATIKLRYAPGKWCVESKSFKLYLAAYRNHGSFMESITNKIADDLIEVLLPRRLSLEGIFNVRGGTAITVRVEYLAPELLEEDIRRLKELW